MPAGESPQTPHIAYFVTPHGYGHAARAAAVMAEVSRKVPGVTFDIFTLVPEWFFRESIPGPIRYHPLLTDIGLVQDSALKENIGSTCDQLDAFLPFSEVIIQDTADTVLRRGCSLVICDIAPLGISVAHAAGVPSILVESFTWDWIYAEYASDDLRMLGHATYLSDVFASADYLVQTAPVCLPRPADLTSPPVSRQARHSRTETRRRLSLPADAWAVLVTMGGVPWQHSFLDRLATVSEVHFLVPGAGNEGADPVRLPDNVHMLPPDSGFFHPDLIATSDAVIGKAGYSTVAEIYWAGVPFGYVSRSRFREAPVLERFLHQEVPCISLSQAEFEDGAWLDRLPHLLSLPTRSHHGPNGAAVVAEFILDLMT